MLQETGQGISIYSTQKKILYKSLIKKRSKFVLQVVIKKKFVLQVTLVFKSENREI